jgi:hypothetical protein
MFTLSGAATVPLLVGIYGISMDSSTFSYEIRTKSEDPHAPTVIFLDDFRTSFEQIAPAQWEHHGTISLEGARQSGYSTIGIEFNDPYYANRGYANYDQPLNRIDADIHSGPLKGLGKGDVLNISLVNPPQTFEEASKFLGFEVTAENLADKKLEILNRLEQISVDPYRSDDDRTTALRAVHTNAAIRRLQADGITVIHSAGNSRANTFGWDFLEADVELSSAKPSGTPDSFAVSNSLTKKSDGVLPVIYHAGADIFDPTPIDRQRGSFEIVGTGISFPNESLTSFVGNTKVFNRETTNPMEPLPIAQPPEPKYSEGKFLSPPTTSEVMSLSPWQKFQESPVSSTYRIPDLGLFGLRFHTIDPQQRPAVALTAGDTLVAGVVVGTSFSNIHWLQDRFAEFRQMKMLAEGGPITNQTDVLPPSPERIRD